MLYSLINGDALSSLRAIEANTIQTCITSPPYFGLRDYGVKGQIGLESTPDDYIMNLVEVFREVRRVLRDDGTLWLNIGDSYATRKIKTTAGWIKAKDIIGIPWMLALAFRADGWYLRQEIIWHKPNAMPESVTDRCTKAHEDIFLLSKSPQYFFDHAAIKETATSKPVSRDKHGEGYQADYPRGDRFSPGERVWAADGLRAKRSVWTVPTKPYAGAHFAVFPPALIEPCVLAGSRAGDLVLDPFNGSGTTGEVALRHGRRYVGIELNRAYIELTEKRLGKRGQRPENRAESKKLSDGCLRSDPINTHGELSTIDRTSGHLVRVAA